MTIEQSATTSTKCKTVEKSCRRKVLSLFVVRLIEAPPTGEREGGILRMHTEVLALQYSFDCEKGECFHPFV